MVKDIPALSGDVLNFEEVLVQITDKTKGFSFWAKLELTDKEIEVVLNGGQLRTLKKQLEAEKEA